MLTHSATMLELDESMISMCGQSSLRVQRVSDDNTVDLADKQKVKDANRPLHASAKQSIWTLVRPYVHPISRKIPSAGKSIS